MSQIYAQFPTLESFYAFWDTQDHTKHTAEDYALRAIIISTLKNESPEQMLYRLKRCFPSIHSYKKWKTPEVSGRWCFDTLKNVLCSLRSGDWRLRTFRGLTPLGSLANPGKEQVNNIFWTMHQMLPERESLHRPDKDDIKLAA